MLGCSRGSTAQVYPLAAFEEAAGGRKTLPCDTTGYHAGGPEGSRRDTAFEAPAGARALPPILPGGIMTGGGRRLTQTERPGASGEAKLAVQDEVAKVTTGGPVATALEGLETGSDSSELDPTFRHSYSRDQAILIRRLRRIEGQVRGIERMIERREYCIDILQQTAALRAAVDSVALLILEDHVQGCVRTAAEKGDADRYIEEVLDVVRRTLGKPVRNPRV